MTTRKRDVFTVQQIVCETIERLETLLREQTADLQAAMLDLQAVCDLLGVEKERQP